MHDRPQPLPAFRLIGVDGSLCPSDKRCSHVRMSELTMSKSQREAFLVDLHVGVLAELIHVHVLARSAVIELRAVRDNFPGNLE